MLIYDISNKDKVFDVVTNYLRNIGIKSRIKRNVYKAEIDDKPAISTKKVFNVALTNQPLEAAQLSSGAIVDVPLFVKHAIIYLDKCLHQEGLFRKAGSQTRIKELVTRVDTGHGLGGGKYHAIDVAHCLKKYFRDLPEPIIPFIYHDLFVRCGMTKSTKVDAILMACLLLPTVHLNTLAFFMDFLYRVSQHEDKNKMSCDNLAKVVGPNIMPLRETTTITAMQNRLEAHLSIVKILIENSAKIGMLSKDIMDNIPAESYSSMDMDIDRSTEDRLKEKKKKHRSGSLTRMFNGLRKIVGKNGDPEHISGINDNQSGRRSAAHELSPLCSPNKAPKKRRNGEISLVVPINNKKKRRSLESILSSATLLNRQSFIPSPTDKNENNLDKNLTAQKSKIRKYLPHGNYLSGTKIDKPKKIAGLSLDRFVSRSKQIINESSGEKEKNSLATSPIERRWSTSSGISSKKSIKKRRLQNFSATSLISSPSLTNPNQKEFYMKNDDSDQFDRIFMDADVNLSDENADNFNASIRRCKSSRRHSLNAHINSNNIDNGNIISNINSNDNVKSTTIISTQYDESNKSSIRNELNEEYVKIPKSEYEEIKNRVSAIENRITQELDAILDHSPNKNVKVNNSLHHVQSEYEKTLGESSIESINTADHLARRLSKELKIRRSAEHKVIRSPSARRISSLRRRSQEKPITGRKRVSRMSSWHVSEKADDIDTTPKSTLSISKSTATGSYQDHDDVNSFCSAETNARLNYLQQQLSTLINHTAEHTGSLLSDDDNLPIINASNRQTPVVRRASSSYGNKLNNESAKFSNPNADKMKKVNSQINVIVNNNGSGCNSDQNSDKFSKEIGSEKRISWKNASTYLDAGTPLRSTFNASLIQSGRASVAKLRTQNAGMVMAKARLFDHHNGRKTTPEVIMEHQKFSNVRRGIKDGRNVTENRKKKSKSPKINGLSMNNTNSPSDSNISGRQSLMEKRRRINSNLLFENQENKLADNNNPNRRESIRNLNLQQHKQSRLCARIDETELSERELINRNTEIIDVTGFCYPTTPHIKKPLSIKTPKSGRSLVKRQMIDSRRTPLKAVPTALTTPRRQSPRYGYKSKHLNIRNCN